MPEGKNQGNEETPENEPDFVWRFEIGSPEGRPVADDPLAEMIRAFLADFLEIGFLTKQGVRVDVDGFIFTKDLDTIYEIFPDQVQGLESDDNS